MAKVDLEPSVEEEINSTMDDLEAAWEEVESRDAPPAEKAELEEEVEVEEVEEGEEEPAPLAAKEGEPAPKAEEPPAPEEKPPAGWKPEAREHWKSLNPDVRREILRRERDFAIGIQYTREAAKRGQQFEELVQPFQPMFRANGQNEVEGVRNVLQVAATLQMGSTGQKVKAVADLINNFGVDLQALDSYLAEGGVPQQVEQNDQLNQMLQQRLAPYERFMQQYAQQQQAQTRQMASAASQTIEQFAQDPQNEFYRDVRMDMADILDMAAKRGVNMTLKDAYDRACMMNPEISSVIISRRQAESIPKKRSASVSVRGKPSGPRSGVNVPQDLRSEIEAAWDNMEQK